MNGASIAACGKYIKSGEHSQDTALQAYAFTCFMCGNMFLVTGEVKRQQRRHTKTYDEVVRDSEPDKIVKRRNLLLVCRGACAKTLP